LAHDTDRPLKKLDLLHFEPTFRLTATATTKATRHELHHSSAPSWKHKPSHEGNTEIAKNDRKNTERIVETKVKRKSNGKTA
jgi:hypothetical protein